MASPAQRVCHIGSDPHVAEGLARTHHTLVSRPEDASLIVLSTRGDGLFDAISSLESLIRPGQVVVHTDPRMGAQVLDPLEVRGALCVALGALGDMWCVSAVDELGTTIGTLLASEMGGVSIVVDDADRPLIGRVAAALDTAADAYADARRILLDVTGQEDVAERIISEHLDLVRRGL
ncbi:hypothetical protein [Corynebacterium glucuronolyticum]|uniref:Putative oxidoreductase/dehydrogenase Rossmann-like domain-containing protein n=2 Tax=Corynebacterium glucuronolyticum TaxID=39791 RepID=A0AAX1L745_9CORY|nr:hypothetical protein [Corynebacterium glucuronolyticum]EEI64168.1 hypothetical protein HMPREF0293_0255 [Corynebacterium glucuronolyticum ATCC 51866]QRP70274.1 hypothetical protein I6J21_11015 [Corynebacterium glucuronolyticum]